MADTRDCPTRIAGKSVEDIASKLYNSLISAHPGSEGRFLLSSSPDERPNAQGRRGGVKVSSCGEFIEQFRRYNQYDGDFFIRYGQKGQYSDPGYIVRGRVKEASEYFSGFGYHRKKCLRSLVWYVKTKMTPLKYQRVRSWLMKVIQQLSKDINLVKDEPFYITLKHESSRD